MTMKTYQNKSGFYFCNWDGRISAIVNNIGTRIPVTVIEGDGIGAEIMAAATRVLERAVEKAYAGQRSLVWQKALAGSQALAMGSDPLPESTLHSVRENKVALKGPLTTPVSGGIQSLNVLLRQTLDLYICLRPVHRMAGLPSPLAKAGPLDVVIFRENSEDLYTGIEFPAGTPDNQHLLDILAQEFPQAYQQIPIKENVGIALKPISKEGSQRFTRAAIRWAVDHKRKKITLVHKGNIMKYTEGAFLQWSYDVAEVEFIDTCFSQRRFKKIQKEEGTAQAEKEKALAVEGGKIMVNDLIADVAFEQAILQPQSFDVVVTTNLNGDYLSDTFAALAGGVGISPGANLNPEQDLGVFEANHGSADELAGKNSANPCSMILSGAMLLDFIHWEEAASLVRLALESTIAKKQVTFDLARLIPDAIVVGTREFGQHVIDSM
jgi:isocitrate dehydrogenase